MGSVSKAFGWKLLERFGVQGIQFVLQIILARLLSPEHYGVLSIMIIFTTLANVFIQTGFNGALIQKKKITEDDYSSAFWVSLIIATIAYIILFFAAPLIGKFYNMPEIVKPFRYLGIMLFPGALNSIQLAKVSREMNFKNVFASNLGAIVISGAVGIAMAYMGGGLWSLVAQNLLNVFIATIVMIFTVKWCPKFVLNLRRVEILFDFGWKLLVSGLIDTLYQDLRSLVIGKKYDSGTLGYYNRGKQFPQFLMNSINSSVQSVMLPAMSKEQDEKSKVKAIMRTSMSVSAYIIFPMMAGLAAVATPLISFLLTDKWLPAVPYMIIYCFTMAFYPIHSCNLQAINAMGRSDIFLKLEIVKKVIGITALVIAIFCFQSPIAIAMTGVFTTIISSFINAFPNKKLIGYSYFEQIKDLLPSFLASISMFVAVYAISYLSLPSIVVLLIQIFAGVLIYVAISAIFRLKGFKFLLSRIKPIMKKIFKSKG